MARAPDERIEQAKAMYLKGMKLVEIASQLNIPEGTVRRWKCTHKWDNERSDKKANVRKRKKEENSKNKKAIAEAVDQVIDNLDLTDKQRLFCLYYVRCFNATKAYQKAYGCSYETALTNGSALLGNTRIKKEILKLKKNRLNREMLDESDIFQKYMDIAFSDITDYVTFGQEEVPVMAMYGPVEIEDEETGKKVPLTKRINVVKFRESNEVDGTLITEVKQGRDGASIKLADRMKALDWLAEHMDMATEEQRAKIDQMRANTVRLRSVNIDDGEDGVMIVNDAPRSENLGHSNSEISSDI